MIIYFEESFEFDISNPLFLLASPQSFHPIITSGQVSCHLNESNHFRHLANSIFSSLRLCFLQTYCCLAARICVAHSLVFRRIAVKDRKCPFRLIRDELRPEYFPPDSFLNLTLPAHIHVQLFWLYIEQTTLQL